MTILFISLVLQLSLLPVPTESQTDVPKYDFWDDSVFDNIKKMNYSAHTPDVLMNVSPGACVKACLSIDSCVSLFYHAREKRCERVPINLLLNTENEDRSLQFFADNRYYRYIPPGKEYCKLENCFYYDRKAKACWKVLFGSGPRIEGRFTYKEALRACEQEGGQIASLDTVDKMEQVTLMLRNIPAVTREPRKWRWFFIGGTRSNHKERPVWQNGVPVSNDSRFLHSEFYQYSTNPNSNCLVLAGEVEGDVIVTYRLIPIGCNSLRPGTVCEMLPK